MKNYTEKKLKREKAQLEDKIMLIQSDENLSNDRKEQDIYVCEVRIAAIDAKLKN